MRPGSFASAVMAASAVTAALAQAPATSQPTRSPGLAAPQRLRCEYLVDPLGLDRTTPRLSWVLDDSRRGAVQRAYQILVADTPEFLSADPGNLWDSGKVLSSQTLHVEYAGQKLHARMRAFWKVRVWDKDDQPSPWSEPARWSMGLDPTDWSAKWIGDSSAAQLTTRSADELASRPASGREPLPPPMLRKSFTLPDEPDAVKAATVYVTALGLYELRINGRRVGDHVLAPEWTDYHKRVQYQTYDVTTLLRPGPNAIGALLADGWYAGRIGLTQIVPDGPARGIYGRRPRFLLQLEIELADGRTIAVASDESWRMTCAGPLRTADLLDGEDYDARRESPGWDTPEFDDSVWKPVDVFPVSAARLVAQPNEPIRVIQEVKPVALTEPRPGVYVFDLGQNFAGWCRIKLTGPAGTTVMLRHAEVLNPDSTIYTANLRSAAQTDRYALSGRGAEVFEPRFTYHGFRYVEVTGMPTKPALDALVGCVVCSSAPLAGRFECSSPLLNKLMENILWTQRANMMSVPTDCPQRDERLGWMGDILAFAQTACFNLDMAAFFTKWVPDVRDAQTEDGRYPDFAPHPFDPAVRFSSVAGWGDAGVVVPWQAYVNYADKRLLAEHFDSARRWVEFVHARNPDLLWKNSRGNDYGDWLNADTLKLEGWPKSGAEVPKEVFATLFFAHSAELVARMADALGRAEDANRYSALADEIKAAFGPRVCDRRQPHSGRYPSRLCSGAQLQLAPGVAAGGCGRVHARRVRDLPRQHLDRLSQHDLPHAGALARRFQRRGVPPDQQSHHAVLGLRHRPRGHDHLGALGRLRGRPRLSGPGHELVQPLCAGLGRRVDVPHDHRHQPGRVEPGLQALHHSSAGPAVT